jgi:hypothetical protein
MPQSGQPLEGPQAWAAKMAAILTRITNLENWQRIFSQSALQAPVISTHTRVFGSLYTPSATRPVLVLATVTVTANSQVNFDVGGSSVAEVSNAPSGMTIVVPCAFLVPAGATYELVATFGSPTLSSVTEYQL